MTQLNSDTGRYKVTTHGTSPQRPYAKPTRQSPPESAGSSARLWGTTSTYYHRSLLIASESIRLAGTSWESPDSRLLLVGIEWNRGFSSAQLSSVGPVSGQEERQGHVPKFSTPHRYFSISVFSASLLTSSTVLQRCSNDAVSIHTGMYPLDVPPAR